MNLDVSAWVTSATAPRRLAGRVGTGQHAPVSFSLDTDVLVIIDNAYCVLVLLPNALPTFVYSVHTATMG